MGDTESKALARFIFSSGITPGIKFMRMPEQPGDDTSALGDAAFRVFDEQPQFRSSASDVGAIDTGQSSQHPHQFNNLPMPVERTAAALSLDIWLSTRV